MKKTFLLATIVSLCAAATSHAATFNFSYTFDGTTLTQDAGSDTAGGTVLSAGDSFVLSVAAADGFLWKVIDPVVNTFVPLSFAVEESGDRSGDIDTTWLLDSGTVLSTSEKNVFQSEVHVGAQTWNLASGFMFDQVVIDYTLLSARDLLDTMDIDTTIRQTFSNFILENSHTFYAGGPSVGTIEFQEAAPIPLPAGFPLLLAGVGALVMMRRKAKS